MPAKTWHGTVFAAVAVGVVDWVGKTLIVSRLGETGGPSSVSLAAWCVGLALVFTVGRQARDDALSVLLPAACLALVGDLIAFRVHVAGAGSSSGAPLLSAFAFAAGLFAFRDVQRVGRWARLLGLIGLVLIGLPLLPIFGVDVGGQRIAVHIGSMLVMPGELGRPLVMLGLAAGLAEMPFVEGADISLKECRPELFRALTLPVFAVFLQLAEGDLGPTVMIAVATTMAIAASTGRIRWMIGGAAILLYALVLGASMSRTIDGRIQDVLDPLRLSGGAYMQAGLAHIGLAWGKWWGTGLGGGVVAGAQGGVPLGSTDLALVTWGTETGLIGIAIVAGLFGIIIWKLFGFSLRTSQGFPRIAGYAFASIVCVQVVWVTGAVLGVLPLSGLATPFVSGGRSAPMSVAFMLGFACRLPRVGSLPRQVRGVDPLRTIRLLRTGAVLSLLGVAAFATAHIEAQATSLDRRVNNPLRELSTVRRGAILGSNGQRLAWTVGADSLETVERRYAHGLADIVGRMSSVDAGSGLELAWGPTLRCAGSGQATAREASTRVIGDPAECQPANIILTIDDRLQVAAEHALDGATGAVAVIDAHSGAVLALAGHDPSRPQELAGLRLGAQTAIAPGSTFKTVTAAAALMGRIDTSTEIRSVWQPPDGPPIHNAGGESCGGSLRDAIEFSCNTSLAAIATRLGPDRLIHTASMLGLGTPTPLSGLPTATSSTIGSDANEAEVAAAGFGQGTDLASPLQMAVVAASFANGGYRVTPGLVAAVCRGGALISRPPRPRVRALSREVSRQVASYMLGVTLSGTAHALHVPDAWATKTGTAELPALRASHTPAGTAGWIIGFPTRGPAARRIAVAVMVLPDRARADRSGPLDGVDVLRAIAMSAVQASTQHQRQAQCSS
jgi:peptidoglycan glycosyltransferase